MIYAVKIPIIYKILIWIKEKVFNSKVKPFKTKSKYIILSKRTSEWGCLNLIERNERRIYSTKYAEPKNNSNSLMIGASYIFNLSKLKYKNSNYDIGLFLDELGRYSKSYNGKVETHQITIMKMPRFKYDLQNAEVLHSEAYDLQGRYTTPRFASFILYKVAELLLYRHLNSIRWEVEVEFTRRQVLKV